MAGVARAVFGGGEGPAPIIFQAASPPPQPEAPRMDDPAKIEAERREKIIAANTKGRSSTILTDFALAQSQPSVLKKSLGGS